MRYDDDVLAERLAAEYALGSLRGAARRRFESLMRERHALREKVLRWEEELYPLSLRAPPVKAPRRVWRRVQARIGRRSPAPWGGWWRLAAFASVVLALVAAVLWGQQREPALALALLAGERAEPAILVTWTPDRAPRGLHVRILSHPSMPPDTSWQAWAEQDGVPPVALGFVSTEVEQRIELSPRVAGALARATRIGVSVEPKGGSSRPSGAYLFEGPVLRMVP